MRRVRRVPLALTAVAAVFVLATPPASAAPGAGATADNYVSPAAGTTLERGASVEFSVRARAGSQVFIVVATLPLTDPGGRLFSIGDFGGIARASADDPTLYRWDPPASAPLRRRPGSFYWQARVYDVGGTATYGPVRSLHVVIPSSWKQRSPIPGWIGRHGTTRFLVSRINVPVSIGRAAFYQLVSRSARRWGLRAVGWTNHLPGTADRVNVVGFRELPQSVLGLELERYARVFARRRGPRARAYLGRFVAERDVVIGLGVPWMKHAEYPDDSHIDLESVVLHELGHMAGNRHHEPRCTNSPMVESIGTGEWWHTPQDWFERTCADSGAARARSAARRPAVASDVVQRWAPDITLER
jgi:hypothetical protein